MECRAVSRRTFLVNIHYVLRACSVYETPQLSRPATTAGGASAMYASLQHPARSLHLNSSPGGGGDGDSVVNHGYLIPEPSEKGNEYSF